MLQSITRFSGKCRDISGTCRDISGTCRVVLRLIARNFEHVGLCCNKLHAFLEHVVTALHLIACTLERVGLCYN